MLLVEGMTTPRPAPQTRFYPVNGIELAVHEWASQGGGMPLVFAHATGFHGRVWDAVAELFPTHPVHAIDLRGHGLSRAAPIADWRLLSGDVSDFFAQAGITGAVGIGHSMGAHTLLQVAADNPHPAIRRKRDFASPEAMIERFASRDPYDLFAPRVFEDYCRHGLVPAASGEGMELACAPEVEASVYASSRSNPGILEAATRVDIPVLVVRAKHTSLNDFKSSPTWPDLAARMPQGTDLYRPDMTHFHPFQDPGDAARIIADFMGEA